MTMKNFGFILGIWSLLPLSIWGQGFTTKLSTSDTKEYLKIDAYDSDENRGKVYFGGFLGYNYSTISVPSGSEKPDWFSNANLGLTFGYAKRINIQLDAFLVTTGFKTTDYTNIIANGGVVKTQTYVNRILAPLQLGFHIGQSKAWYVQGGGFGSYLLNGRQTVEKGNITRKQDLDFSGSEGRIEYGAVGGLGFVSYGDKRNRKFIEARWYHGLGNDTGISSNSGFLRMIAIHIGTTF
jgi:hypothetical protein